MHFLEPGAVRHGPAFPVAVDAREVSDASVSEVSRRGLSETKPSAKSIVSGVDHRFGRSRVKLGLAEYDQQLRQCAL